MKRNFSYNLLIATLFCCGFTVNAQNLQDEGVSAMSAPWKTQFKAASVGYVYGDVNGDEKTDISDIVSIINAISQDDGSNPRADVNEDGSIDISDIVKVINIIAGVDTPPITVDKSILDMTTGESEDVRIVRVSGSGDYEVTNENPEIVTVEWLSGSSTASERRKVKAAGDTEIGEGDSFSTDGFLKVYALQPGQAKITVLDKSTSRKLVVSITVTADYNTEIFTDISPYNATYVSGSTVACKFTVTTPSAAELKCRIILSEEPDMSETTQVAEITINGTEGEETVYNENGETTTFFNLKSDTKYYWRILYYDTQSGSYMNGSPINWFKTITLCPDENHPHIIDMGEAGKWACCNVGASAPWEYGGYYAWGETEEKENYNWSTYKHCDGSEDSCHYLGEDIAGTDYDVAHVKWGEDWQMPSEDQLIMLINNSSSEWIIVNGVAGRRLTGSNGGSIFLPDAGYRWDDDALKVGGNYWSSTQYTYFGAYILHFFNSNFGNYFRERGCGQSIRPVISESESEDPAVAAGLCPDTHHPHIIDMGEAGKWACCNVGASAPWEYGGYYAWGETEEKEGYDWSTYIHCDGSEDSCYDLGSNISGTQYDVAHVKWGSKWCMPSNQQIHLLENCSSEWTELNGINGRKFTAPNGGTIFLPAAGGRYRYNDPDDVYSDGSYWSSSQCPSPSYYAYFLQFGSDFTRWYGSYRRIGRSVRPVIDQSEPLDPAVEFGLCPDSNHPHVIDMGDAGKWSCCNVGASAPWEYGGYYAWGETEEKESYSWKNYIHCDGSYDTCHDLGEDIAGTEYDVAHVKWGGNWCMPSRIQQDNLIQNCSSEWTSLNGVFGRKYISPDGGAIFLPAAGYTRYEESMSINEDGNYWSSTPYGYVTDKNSQAAFYLNFNNNKNEWHFTARVWGRTVRPVIYESEPDFEPEPEDPANLCPDENHPHIIDMGDAGKWACCNVGASAPWEYGGYYAWGETEEKDNYSVETYIHCNGSIETCHAIGDDIAGTEYDVAHVKWGDTWCLPSIEQIKNLLNHSTSEWRTVNGIKGIKFTATNGKTIFLPAAARYNSDDVGVLGYYWSSMQNPNELYYAYSLNFNPTDSYWSNSNTRNYGFSVRPVTE